MVIRWCLEIQSYIGQMEHGAQRNLLQTFEENVSTSFSAKNKVYQLRLWVQSYDEEILIRYAQE